MQRTTRTTTRRASMALGVSLLVLTAGGCASQAVVPVARATVEPRAPGCSYETYASESEVGRPFETTCILDSRTGTTIFHRHSIEAAMEKVQDDICACGGDAIIIDSTERRGVSLANWGQGSITLRVIRYTSQDTTSGHEPDTDSPRNPRTGP